MKGLSRCILVLISLGLMLVNSIAYACSTFVLNDQHNRFYAHHLDERSDTDGLVVINKRGTRRQSVDWNQLISGKPGKNIFWEAKFGSISLNIFGIGMPDGGVNEKGLFIQEMSLAGSRAPVNGRVTIYASSWIQYVLDNFETVDQAIDSLKYFSVDGMEWHYLLADASGNKAVVEMIDGKIVLHQNTAMKIPLVCNEPYAQEYRKFSLLDNQAKSDITSLDRFSRGALTIENTAAEGVTLERTFKILDSLQQEGTRWTYVFDVKKQVFYFKTSNQSQLRHFSWAAVDFANGPTLAWDIHENDQEKWFKPASKFIHEEAVKKAMDQFVGWVGEDKLNNYLRSVGGSVDMLHVQLASTRYWIKDKEI